MEMFVYPKEKPPELYIFQSWHFRRAYRRALVADKMWNDLLKAVKLDELLAYLDKPLKVHDRVHHAFRFVVDVQAYIKDLPHLEPREDWIGEQIHEFVKWYVGLHPEAAVAQAADPAALEMAEREKANLENHDNVDLISEQSEKSEEKPEEEQPKRRGRPPKAK